MICLSNPFFRNTPISKITAKRRLITVGFILMKVVSPVKTVIPPNIVISIAEMRGIIAIFLLTKKLAKEVIIVQQIIVIVAILSP
jgi:hypothetical protein